MVHSSQTSRIFQWTANLLWFWSSTWSRSVPRQLWQAHIIFSEHVTHIFNIFSTNSYSSAWNKPPAETPNLSVPGRSSQRTDAAQREGGVATGRPVEVSKNHSKTMGISWRSNMAGIILVIDWDNSWGFLGYFTSNVIEWDSMGKSSSGVIKRGNWKSGVNWKPSRYRWGL